jgi:ParB/RepB/Spo0J family partition protein
LVTQMLKLDQISVEQGFNPRTQMEIKALEGLSQSIAEEGLLVPLVVREDEQSGGFKLVDGHRRFAAAELARLEEVPVVVRTGEPHDHLVAALVANLQREDLNPLDEANGYRRLVEAGLTTPGVAQRLGVAQKRVTDRLGLLELGPEAQKFARDDRLPMGIVSTLRTIAKVNKRIADACARAVVEGELEPTTFRKEPLATLARFQVSKEYPAFVTGRDYNAELFDITDAELAERAAPVLAAHGYIPLQFTEADLDAAKAFGVAVFAKGSSGAILDWDFACERAAAKLKRKLKALEERVEREESRSDDFDAREKIRKGLVDDSGSPLQSEEQVKAKKRELREQELAQRALSTAFNDALGTAFLKSTAKVKLTKEVALLVVGEMLDAEGVNYCLTGMRYVHPNWREVETKALKGGGERSKITYADRAECERQLADWLGNASSPEEILGRGITVLLASRLADDRCVSQSVAATGRRPSTRVQHLIDDVAKALLPDELLSQAARAQSHQQPGDAPGDYGDPGPEGPPPDEE